MRVKKWADIKVKAGMTPARVKLIKKEVRQILKGCDMLIMDESHVLRRRKPSADVVESGRTSCPLPLTVCTHCRDSIRDSSYHSHSGHTFHIKCAVSLGLVTLVERDPKKWGGHTPAEVKAK